MNRKDSYGKVLKDGEYQRTNGRYRYIYRISGKQKEVSAWTLHELRDKEKQIRRDIMDGINSADTNFYTLNDLFNRYIKCKMELKATTRANYIYMYKKYVYKQLGYMKISKISYSDIRLFYNSLIYDNKLKIGSVGVVDNVLHPVFAMAVRDNLISKNTDDGVIRELKKIYGHKRGKRCALTEEEQNNFLIYIYKSNVYRHWFNIFVVLLGTGCRVGEIIGLTWEDCDFNNNFISINHSVTYKPSINEKCELHITTPKTFAGYRKIPMLSIVRQALADEYHNKLKSNYSIDGYSDFIFLNREGHLHKPMDLNRAIIRIINRYNRDNQSNKIRRFSVHNLRHTFCTRLCENENNIKVIQEVMGHSNITTTMNVYAEVTDSKMQEAISKIDDKIIRLKITDTENFRKALLIKSIKKYKIITKV